MDSLGLSQFLRLAPFVKERGARPITAPLFIFDGDERSSLKVRGGMELEQHFLQEGLECMSMSVIYGYLAYKGSAAAQALRSRMKAAFGGNLPGVKSSCFPPMPVIEKFVDEGSVNMVNHYNNSFMSEDVLLRDLFQERTFLAIAQQVEAHAYCIVPLDKPTNDEFVVKIDGYFHDPCILSRDEFLTLIRKTGAESFLFQVEK